MSNQSPVVRTTNGRFGAGNSGRPKGTANKANLRAVQAALSAIYADMFLFLRDNFPEAYASLAVHVLLRAGKTADKRSLQAAVAGTKGR